MKTLVICSLLFIITTSATAIAPPAIEWEETYFQGNYSRFYDVIEASDGGFIVAGFRLHDISSPGDTCLFKLDSSGNLQWAIETEYFNKSLRKVLQMDNLDYISVGAVKALPTSNTSLLLLCTEISGDIVWSQVFEYSNSSVYGSDLDLLPDGGFAVCGYINPTTGMDQALILRTDAQGDTLWAREWGWNYTDRALKVLFIDNGLTVLIYGRLQGSTYGTYLVRYDLDGNLLWETGIPELSGQIAQDMCEANDGGLFILDNYVPSIYHTDYYGHYEWHFGPPGAGQPYGWTIDTTMDGGIIYGGENADNPPNLLLSIGRLVSTSMAIARTVLIAVIASIPESTALLTVLR